MDLDGQLLRHFRMNGVDATPAAAIEMGVDGLCVEFGLATDRPRRFDLRSLPNLDRASDPEVAVRGEVYRDAAHRCMDRLAAAGAGT